MNEEFFATKRNRSLLGLLGAVPLAIVAVLLFEGVILWLLLGIAAVDAVLVPYLLGRALESSETG